MHMYIYPCTYIFFPLSPSLFLPPAHYRLFFFLLIVHHIPPSALHGPEL